MISLPPGGKEWPKHFGRIVFAQVMDVLPMHEFRKCVRRYQGERRVRTSLASISFFAWHLPS